MKIKLMFGDCLERMKELPDNSIDLVLTDPPYGTTKCKWDNVIEFEPMWTQLKRVTKDRSAICLFGSEPFSSALRMSNIKMFKYDWVWEKNTVTNHLNAKKMPLRRNEIVSLFYNKQCLYHPQLANRVKCDKTKVPMLVKRTQCSLYGKMDKESERTIPHDKLYPTETLKFDSPSRYTNKRLHPTQKPVPLLEYLIKTYTLENETVLDFTMGSGSTGVACKNLNRNFIGIENNKEYFKIAVDRIKKQ